MAPDTEREPGRDPTPSLGMRAGWVTLGRLFHVASILLVWAVLSRALSPESYGQYQRVWIYLNIAIPLFLFGMPLSINYFLAPVKGLDRDRQAIQHVVLIVLLAALFALAAGCFWMAGAGSRDIPAETSSLVPFMLLIGSGMIACGFLEPVLIIYGRHRALAGSLLLFAALHIAAVLAGWFLGGSLWWIFACLSGAVGLRVAWSYHLLFRLVRPLSAALLRPALTEPLKYVWPIGLREGVEVFSRFADKVIFDLFFTAAQLAFYINGAWELPLVGVVAHSLLAVLLPELRLAYSRGEMDRVLALMHFAARRVALLLFPAGAFCFSVAPELMSFLFSETYRASGTVFRVFLLLLPLRVSTAGFVLLAANRTRAVLLGTMVDLVVVVGLGVALIPWLGTLGPAVAMVVSTSCQVGLYNWRASAVLERSLTEILPWRALGRLALASLIAALGASFAMPFESEALNLAAAGAVFVLLLAGLGLGLRLFEAEERGVVTSLRRRAAARCRALAG